MDEYSGPLERCAVSLSRYVSIELFDLERRKNDSFAEQFFVKTYHEVEFAYGEGKIVPV